MSQSEFNPAPVTAKAGQVWRTKAGGLHKIPEGVNPLIFDLVEMVRDEDGFTIWHGGACPVPHTSRVEARLRSGASIGRLARGLTWSHGLDDSDIIAYKVVETAKDPLDDATICSAMIADGKVTNETVAERDRRLAKAAAIGIDCGTENGKHTVGSTLREVLGVEKDTREYTGGKVNYYEVPVANPTRQGRDPYTAECNDIIEALDMSFAEGEAFKAIWRGAAARKNLAKRGYTDGLYDAEKVTFYGGRMVAQEKSRREKSSSKD